MADLRTPITALPMDSLAVDDREAAKPFSQNPSTPAERPIIPAESSISKGAAEPPDPLDAYVIGYPKMAARMSLIPETAMFRRFGALNARNLLYFQSELSEIEEYLKELDREDHTSTVGKKKMYARDFYWLKNATTERDGDVKQRDLVMRMRETLKEYNHALLQQQMIFKMPAPDAYDITNIRRFISSDSMNYNNVLSGYDLGVWGNSLKEDSHSKELVVLRGREAPDSFSRLASSISVPFVKRFGLRIWNKPDPAYGAITVKDATVLNLTFWITSIIASVMPVFSLVFLSQLEKLNLRLAMIGVSNMLLSVCLLLFTEARRTDVFAITATFTVVQVLFIGQ